MLIAVYRCLYGEDFVEESIRSILPHVDRVVVIVASRPWGSASGVMYRGEWITWPRPFDGLRDRVIAMGGPIDVIDDFYPTPFGQYDHIVKNVLTPRSYLPSDIMFIEPDHVFSNGEASNAFHSWNASSFVCAGTRQVELWSPPGYLPVWRVPERIYRSSVIIHRNVRPNQNLTHVVHGVLDGTVHNLGFCFSLKTMRWKHLTAMSFSAEIGDSVPDPDWLEKTWLAWHPTRNNYNLEISLGAAANIPKAISYDPIQLPYSIARRYGMSVTGDSHV